MTEDKLEVTRISSLGIWLQTSDKKHFLPYGDFPFFKNKPVKAILNVRETEPGRFYWPEIEVRVGIEAIEMPEKSPLRRNEKFDAYL